MFTGPRKPLEISGNARCNDGKVVADSLGIPQTAEVGCSNCSIRVPKVGKKGSWFHSKNRYAKCDEITATTVGGLFGVFPGRMLLKQFSVLPSIVLRFLLLPHNWRILLGG